MMTAPVIEDARAMLALFARSSWRNLHLRAAGWEMFFAKDGGTRNPMMTVVAQVSDATETAIDAPHLGLFYPSIGAGTIVDSHTVIGQIEVLGEREDVRAGGAGRVTAILVDDGALVEYATPLMRIAA